jgi:Arc/MetJ-type ribon-helix-helix transcriptional regulator
MAVERLPSTLVDERMADWLRPFIVDLAGERIGRLRRSVETLREALSLGNAVDAVAYAYGDKDAGERIIETVRVAMRNTGAAYTAAVSDAEPPVLVAAALADHLAVKPDSELSTLISLLALSADWCGRRAAIEGMRLADYAARQLAYRSAITRRTAQLTTSPSASEFVQRALRSLEAATQDAAHGLHEARRGSEFATFADILIALAARVDELAARSESERAVLREQLRQQTWVSQSWCETAEAEWRDVASEARPIIAAVELAERTWGTTPAAGAEALLGSILATASAGSGVDPIAAVAAAGPYVADRLQVAPHPFLFPLAAELARWRELEADREEPRWRPPEGGLADAGQEETAIAMQAYREVIALRLLGHD